MDETDAWIGLQDPQGTYTWNWEDGTQFGFTNWLINEPNDPNDKCVYVSNFFLLLYYILIILCKRFYSNFIYDF